jgi:hypothetical protein
MKYAFLVGINYIGSEYELNGCINDVNNTKSYLLTKGYAETNIILLTDNTDLKPTRTNILKGLNDLVSKSRPGDTLFWHYSGHGGQTVDLSHDEVPDAKGRALDETIYDVNLEAIVDDELKVILDKVPVGVIFRAFMDCCHSATCCDLPYLYKPSISGGFSTESAVCKGSPNILMVSGCRDAQTSADAFINRKYQGALTWALLDTLGGYSECTWKELLAITRYKLKTGKYSQVPQLSVGDKKLVKQLVDI